MSIQHGGQHGLFGLVSVLLAVKLIIKKGLFLIDDLITHQLFKAPLELLLVELPFSIFNTIGLVVVTITSIEIPYSAAGLIVGYPLMVAFLVSVIEHPSPRVIGSYWFGSTVITGAAVLMSLGMVPDPANVGSGLVYHLQQHTLSTMFRNVVVGFGGVIATIGSSVGIDIDESIGLVIAITVIAAAYGILWEKHIGHE